MTTDTQPQRLHEKTGRNNAGPNNAGPNNTDPNNSGRSNNNNILMCPRLNLPLVEASPSQLEQLNTKIVSSTDNIQVARSKKFVTTLGGTPVTTPITAGLVTEDGAVLYPILEGIPVLIADDGIPL